MESRVQSRNDIIFEEMQTRVTEAQKQLAESAQRLQQMQQIHVQAQNQFNIWNGAFQTLAKERQALELAARESQLPLPGAAGAPEPESKVQPESQPLDQLNKTEFIRDLLRQHPAGMTAGEIWGQVKGQFKYRAYFYNVLKRLRDKDEVSLRRNKYAIKPSVEVNQTSMVQ